MKDMKYFKGKNTTRLANKFRGLQLGIAIVADYRLGLRDFNDNRRPVISDPILAAKQIESILPDLQKLCEQLRRLGEKNNENLKIRKEVTK